MQKSMCNALSPAFLFAALIAVLLLAAGCTPVSAPAAAGNGVQAAPATLNVFAAASLTDAFDEIGAQFAAENPGVEVVFNFAGSNQLATQIGEGAPADVFASANKTQMNVVIEAGRVVSGTQQVFARNRLVVVTPGDNPAGLATLQDLAAPGVKIVFAANEVPAGQYALDFLDKAASDESLGPGYKAAVLANVVSYEENVRGVLTKVTLGEADAGIVYTSDVATAGGAGGAVQQIAIPDALNTLAVYPIAVLSDSPQAALAQAFVDAVLDPAGQGVLAQYGFLPASAE